MIVTTDTSHQQIAYYTALAYTVHVKKIKTIRISQSAIIVFTSIINSNHNAIARILRGTYRVFVPQFLEPNGTRKLDNFFHSISSSSVVL